MFIKDEFFSKLLAGKFDNGDAYALSKLSAKVAIGISIFLLLIKCIACVYTSSIALQASMTDSLMDGFISCVVLFTIHYSGLIEDETHTFGHGKIESLMAIVQAVLVFMIGIFIIKEAFERLSSPEKLENTAIGIFVMVISCCAVYILVSFQQFICKRTESVIVAGDALHYTSDLLTNFGVILSLLFSNIFVHVDSIFGGIAGIYIIFSALKIAKSAMRDLMDEALPDDEIEKIKEIILESCEVKKISKLKTRTSGMRKFIQAQIYVDKNLSFDTADALAEKVEKKISSFVKNSIVLIKISPYK